MQCLRSKKLFWFSRIRHRYPNELRADLQRYYGVNFDHVGTLVSVAHVAALSACLPLGSLVLRKIEPKTTYTETEWLLLGILNRLSDKPYDPFAPRERPKHLALSVRDMEAILSKPRQGVKHDN